MAVGGVRTFDGSVFPVATRTRRTGLQFAGTSRDSRDVSIGDTGWAAIRWSGDLSNELPVQVRFKSMNAMRIISDLGGSGSTATSRMVSGPEGSTAYTSIASATWSEFENIVGNYYALSQDGSQSNILCFAIGTGICSYEVLTLPIASVGIAEDLAS